MSNSVYIPNTNKFVRFKLIIIVIIIIFVGGGGVDLTPNDLQASLD